jgi:transcription antitermination factor NusG
MNENWFAICVKSRHERAVANLLQLSGLESFLPVYRCRKQWSDRVKESEYPLFAGYLFSRFEPSRWVNVVKLPGVFRVVSFCGKPAPVEEAELLGIRTIMNSGVAASPWPYLAEGQRVGIDKGPLRGLQGIIVSMRGAYRLVVSVTLLQRSVAAEIERDWVTPESLLPRKPIAGICPADSKVRPA